MLISNPSEQSNRIADQAAMSADHAIRSTQRVANEALDSLAGSVQDMRHQAAPLLNRATEQVAFNRCIVSSPLLKSAEAPL